MGLEPLYEQLWDVSYDFLKKNSSIAVALTGLMLKRAEHLRSQVLNPGYSTSKTFSTEFRKAHDELQNMGKSLQNLLSDWQTLFIEETTPTGAEDIAPDDELQFDYIKPSRKYEKNQVVKLLVTEIPRTTRGVFCAVDRDQLGHLDRFIELQNLIKPTLTELPPSGEAFAVLLDDVWFRAVRNRPPSVGGKASTALCLLDTGEILSYKSTFVIAQLPDSFQTIPAYFIMCLIVPGETSATFNQFDQIYCKVIDSENDDVLRVEQLPANQHEVTKDTSSKEEQFHEITRDTSIKEDLKQLDSSGASQYEITRDTPSKNGLGQLHESTRDPSIKTDVQQLDSSVGSQYEISRDTLSKEELEQLDELPESTTNAMKAVLGYVPKDDMLICKHYDPKTKNCFKAGNCKLRHIEKDPDGWTRDRDTLSVSMLANMEIPLPNTFVKLQPTFVIDLENFYSQIVPDEGCHAELLQLLIDMNTPEVVAQYKKLKLLPSFGELVLAQYENQWYRATICDLFDKDVGVFYVDYGNAATLTMDEIRMCDDRFKYLPYQAVCCRIANACRVKPYHIEAIEQLTKAILDRQLKALIIDNKTPWEVQLFDEDGFDIGQGMVIAKLALPRKPTRLDDATHVPG